MTTLRNTASARISDLHRMADRMHGVPETCYAGIGRVSATDVRGEHHGGVVDAACDVTVHTFKEVARGWGERRFEGLHLVHSSDDVAVHSVDTTRELRVVGEEVAAALEAPCLDGLDAGNLTVILPDREAMPPLPGTEISRLMAWQATVEMAASIAHICLHVALSVWRDPHLRGIGLLRRLAIFRQRCGIAIRKNLTGTVQDAALAALAEHIGHGLNLPGRPARTWARLCRLFHHGLVPLSGAFRLAAIPGPRIGRRRAADFALRLLLGACAIILFVALEEALEHMLPLHPFSGHVALLSALLSGIAWVAIDRVVTAWDPFAIRKHGDGENIISQSDRLLARGDALLAQVAPPNAPHLQVSDHDIGKRCITLNQIFRSPRTLASPRARIRWSNARRVASLQASDQGLKVHQGL